MKRTFRVGVRVVLLLLLCNLVFSVRSYSQRNEAMTQQNKNLPVITIIYDNNPHDEKLRTGWGFSCVVSGLEKTILFDTGGDGEVLMENMGKSGIAPETIDVVFLSHSHGDHTGGLAGFLKVNPNVAVYLPASFPAHLKNTVTTSGAKLIGVSRPSEIFPDAYSSGELGVHIIEQSLIIRTARGLVIITGCAHPGILEIIEKAKGQLKEDVFLVAGGFHLLQESKKDLAKIISDFKLLGVAYVAPTHCSGDEARQAFAQEYGDRYLKCGAGKVIRLDDLK
ncbi:MAG: MBL fold metallo-hydrolase [Calditrichia bacterium]